MGGGVSPHIMNEYSRLRKVLVTPTPQLVTSFTDLIVNPIQEKALSGIDPGVRVLTYPGAAECHGRLLEVLEENGVSWFFLG